MLARPPQIHRRGRSDRPGAVGADQGVVELDVGVAGGPSGQQGTVQARGSGGQDVDRLVRVPVGGGLADLVVDRELRDSGAVDEPAQHQHGLAVAVQCPSAVPGSAAGPLTCEKAGQERGGGLPDREHGGVGDRIGHAGLGEVDLW
jgi:hypothetical protein